MIGAPSQLDLFDPKPALNRFDGQPCPLELTRGKRFAFIGDDLTLAGSPFRFARHGQSGQEISELLPHLATVADEIAILRGLHTDEINHAPAQMFLHTGSGRGGRPGLGAWVTYGLGTENQDLPAYVVLLSGILGGAGTSLWSNGFLPGVYQGVQFRSAGDPVLFLSNPAGHGPGDRRRVLDAVGALERDRVCRGRRPGNRHADQAVRDGLPDAGLRPRAHGHRAGVARDPRALRRNARQGLVREQLPPGPAPRRARRPHRRTLRFRLGSSLQPRRSAAGQVQRRRPGHVRADQGPQAEGAARRDARHLGR